MVSPLMVYAGKCIRELIDSDTDQLFSQPIDPIKYGLSYYTTMIHHPMDWGTVLSNLYEGVYYGLYGCNGDPSNPDCVHCHGYAVTTCTCLCHKGSIESFFKDLYLVVDNVLIYHPPTTPIYSKARDYKSRIRRYEIEYRQLVKKIEREANEAEEAERNAAEMEVKKKDQRRKRRENAEVKRQKEADAKRIKLEPPLHPPVSPVIPYISYADRRRMLRMIVSLTPVQQSRVWDFLKGKPCAIRDPHDPDPESFKVNVEAIEPKDFMELKQMYGMVWKRS
jgi:hypothetical protein